MRNLVRTLDNIFVCYRHHCRPMEASLIWKRECDCPKLLNILDNKSLDDVFLFQPKVKIKQTVNALILGRADVVRWRKGEEQNGYFGKSFPSEPRHWWWRTWGEKRGWRRRTAHSWGGDGEEEGCSMSWTAESQSREGTFKYRQLNDDWLRRAGEDEGRSLPEWISVFSFITICNTS